jgi:hypothetical protein
MDIQILIESVGLISSSQNYFFLLLFPTGRLSDYELSLIPPQKKNNERV